MGIGIKCATMVSLGLVTPAGVQARAMTLDDITTVDPLGYECIGAQYFQETDELAAAVAFEIGGKIRLPRTCLPEPCEAALTQTELAQLTGTDPRLPRFDTEWGDYYARYADYCRREVNPVSDEPAARGTPEAITAFWAPVLPAPATVATPTAVRGATSPTITAALPPVILRNSPTRVPPVVAGVGIIPPVSDSRPDPTTPGTNVSSGGNPPSGGGTPPTGGGTPPNGGGGGGGDTETLTPVPLAASALMLLTALAGFGGAARARRLRPGK